MTKELSHNVRPHLKSSVDQIAFIHYEEGMQRRDLADLKQIQKSQLPLDLSQFDLRKLVSNVTNMNKIQAKISGQTIKHEVQEDTPDLIIGEKMRFAQILHNSLSNAMHHASNKVPIEIHCFVLPRGQKS